MAEQKRFTVVEVPVLEWPTSLTLATRRFCLFIAADSSGSTADVISEFALAALHQGMVYCAVWGPGCERFHDIIDEMVARDGLNERRFVGPTPNDVIMTTWHADESIEEALEFFTMSALPTEGLLADSDFRVVACIGNPEWATIASRVLQSTPPRD